MCSNESHSAVRLMSIDAKGGEHRCNVRLKDTTRPEKLHDQSFDDLQRKTISDDVDTEEHGSVV